MSNKMCHTATFKGTKVRVALHDGRVFVGKFVARTRNKRVIIEGCPIIRAGDIAQFGEYRPRAGSRG